MLFTILGSNWLKKKENFISWEFTSTCHKTWSGKSIDVTWDINWDTNYWEYRLLGEQEQQLLPATVGMSNTWREHNFTRKKSSNLVWNRLLWSSLWEAGSQSATSQERYTHWQNRQLCLVAELVTFDNIWKVFSAAGLSTIKSHSTRLLLLWLLCIRFLYGFHYCAIPAAQINK